MSARANKPVSVTLGPLASRAEARVRSGDYASVSEVVRAGLRALDREEAALDAILKAKVEEAVADRRPALPAEEAFARMDAFIADYKARRGAKDRIRRLSAGRLAIDLPLCCRSSGY